MCGIAGFYGFKNDDLLKKISQELAHRGPDGEGYYINDKASLLNRRLAIIDLKTGDQPIFNEDKSIVVVYNGEIYNFRQLRRQLEKKGHRFYTNSDTEIIVHGYEEWQEKCFDKFNGMFAIALYDIKKDQLILARDHFGIKPLYYAFVPFNGIASATPRNDSGLIFSSEIKPIINSGLIEKKPNDKVIFRYLKFRVHDDNDQTFFKGVLKLLPGQLIKIQNSKFKIQNYSDLKNSLLKNQNNINIDKFRKELINAIKLRLISDVPVGTCLSGGLDSSTVVAVVNKLLNENVKEACSVGQNQNVFSAVFPNSSNNEERYIDKLKGQMLNVRSIKIYPKPEEFFRDLEDFVRTQEEPTISTGPYAQYKVMQEAKKSVKVLLDGQGADEILAGYSPYYFVYFKQLLNQKKYLTLIKEVFCSSDIIFKYFKQFFLRKLNINQLLQKDFVNKYKHEQFITINNNLKQRLIDDIFHNSLPSLLRYEDKNSMRFSIEGRVPFLDTSLLSLVFSLPDEAIIKDGWNKYILRQSVKTLLPDIIIKRRNKIGFTNPELTWFLRMKNKIYSIYLSESFAKRKYFNQKEVLKAYQLFIEGKTSDTLIFWRLLNMEMWLREFFDKNDKDYNDYKNYKNYNPEIIVDDKKYLRYLIKTDVFKKDDDYKEIISHYIHDNVNRVNLEKNKKWFVVVSEKVIAIAQGRSYFLWDIKTGWWAKLLSRFVKKTPYGIGLGSQWTMQLAINEVGLGKILFASLIGGLGKLGVLGKLGEGIFYKIAGRQVAQIDGPTEYSLYPSNVSAKLGPKEPQKVAEEIKKYLVSSIKYKVLMDNFLGAVVIDANDLGQNVLGNSTNLDNKLIEKIFEDNPMGQSNEQTPITIVLVK